MFRLQPDLQKELTWFWCEFDGDAGLRSNFEVNRAQIERHVVPDEACPSPPPDGIRLALDSPSRRWASKDEQLRQMWETMHVHESPQCAREIDLLDFLQMMRSKVILGERASLVNDALRRMVRLHGPHHERVLYRVYGPLKALRRGFEAVEKQRNTTALNELAQLIEYTDVVEQARGVHQSYSEAAEKLLSHAKSATVERIRTECNYMLEAASRCYVECRRAVVEERKATDDARFAAKLAGGASL